MLHKSINARFLIQYRPPRERRRRLWTAFECRLPLMAFERMRTRQWERCINLGLLTVTYGRAFWGRISYRIVSYRDILCSIVSYPSFSPTAISCHHYNVANNIRKYSFVSRVADIWNSLPDYVVEADSLNAFKNRLDNYRTNHDCQQIRTSFSVWIHIHCTGISNFQCVPLNFMCLQIIFWYLYFSHFYTLNLFTLHPYLWFTRISIETCTN